MFSYFRGAAEVAATVCSMLVGAMSLASCELASELADESPTYSDEQATQLPYPSGRLVYQSDAHNQWDIFLLDLTEVDSGSAAKAEPVRLTTHDANDMNPSFSPDGKSIVFCSERTGAGDLYILDLDDKTLRQLTSHPSYEGAPQFSADGRWVFFEAERDGRAEIYRTSIDGKRVNRLTRSSTRKLGPAVTGHGRYFAYMEKSWIRWQVSVQDWDTGDVRVVSSGGGACRPSFSPDGEWLAYVSTRDADKTDVWIVRVADGTGQPERVRVPTRADAHNYDPAFSPSGNGFAFASTRERGRDEQWDLFFSERRARSLLRLTDTDHNERFPQWSPRP